MIDHYAPHLVVAGLAGGGVYALWQACQRPIAIQIGKGYSALMPSAVANILAHLPVVPNGSRNSYGPKINLSKAMWYLLDTLVAITGT